MSTTGNVIVKSFLPDQLVRNGRIHFECALRFSKLVGDTEFVTSSNAQDDQRRQFVRSVRAEPSSSPQAPGQNEWPQPAVALQ